MKEPGYINKSEEFKDINSKPAEDQCKRPYIENYKIFCRPGSVKIPKIKKKYRRTELKQNNDDKNAELINNTRNLLVQELPDISVWKRDLL